MNLDLNKAQKLKTQLDEYLRKAIRNVDIIKENLMKKQLEKVQEILIGEKANTNSRGSEEINWAVREIQGGSGMGSGCVLSLIEQILSGKTPYNFKEEEKDNGEREREREREQNQDWGCEVCGKSSVEFKYFDSNRSISEGKGKPCYKHLDILIVNSFAVRNIENKTIIFKKKSGGSITKNVSEKLITCEGCYNGLRGDLDIIVTSKYKYRCKTCKFVGECEKHPQGYDEKIG